MNSESSPFNARSPRFPTTHWTMLAAVRGEMTPEHREILNWLITRYWPPVYCFICRRGFTRDAADLTQEFFFHWCEHELFGRAERDIGRFRTFLLACLSNFLKDERRRKRRHAPVEGVVSVHQLASDSNWVLEPADEETPDAIFDRAWAFGLFQTTYGRLDAELTAAGQRSHLKLFRERIWGPFLDGFEPPPLAELAAPLGLTAKQAEHQIITARRAFQRLIREEIRAYASNDDEVVAEVQALFRLLGE